MGALDLTIAMPGLPALTTSLSRYRTDISDWGPFWRDKFAPSFYRTMLESFVLEGGNTGSSWAPLSRPYALWKARRFPGTGILVRSGALKASLVSANGPQAVFRPSSNALEIGTSVPYARFHQYGAPRRNLPQRPPMRVDTVFMGGMGRQLQQFVQEAWLKRRASSIGAVSNAG